MRHLRYTLGDATQPQFYGNTTPIIAHVCNDEGAWGAGFVMALSARDRKPEHAYKRWALNEITKAKQLPLGEIQLVDFDNGYKDRCFVANMIAQRGTSGPQPLDYDALAVCLNALRSTIEAFEGVNTINCSAHMPRIGCGLAGGQWLTVESLVRAQLRDFGISVTVYDLPLKPCKLEAKI